MSFDIEAYKNARIREIENTAREDLAKAVIALHEKVDSLEATIKSLVEHIKNKKKD
jgi:hypothetical protein